MKESSIEEEPKATTASRLTNVIKEAGNQVIQARLAGWITKLRGYGETMIAIADYCDQAGLPPFLIDNDPASPNLSQYKLTLGKLGGVPLSFALKVTQLVKDGPGIDLDIPFRIRR